MENFEHINAKSFEEAGKAVEGNNNFSKVVMAGGTDIMTVMRTHILNQTPDTVVNLKTIENGAYIKDEGDQIAIGAITKLKDVESAEDIAGSCSALGEAAHSVASPLIRNTATIGDILSYRPDLFFPFFTSLRLQPVLPLQIHDSDLCSGRSFRITPLRSPLS